MQPLQLHRHVHPYMLPHMLLPSRLYHHSRSFNYSLFAPPSPPPAVDADGEAANQHAEAEKERERELGRESERERER